MTLNTELDEQGRELFDRLASHGQEHLLTWWPRLTRQQKEILTAQIRSIDFSLLSRLVDELILNPQDGAKAELSPAQIIHLPRSDREREERRKVAALGEEAIRDGKLALLTLAGGQGTRLEFDAPKGLFPICVISAKSLFQLFSESIRALRRRFRCALPWFIMTSDTTDEATQSFFDEHDFFGLPREEVIFFRQDTLPAVDRNGKCLLDAPHHIFVSPNGHGGTLDAMRRNGALDEMARRGIEHIFCFQVDNALIKIGDPVFLGYHLSADAEMSTKVVRKRDPEEGLGIVGQKDGRLTVIEYSDLSREDMYARMGNGELRYAMGSIAIHLFKRSFVERLTGSDFQMPYHRADKEIPFIDEEGKLVKPGRKNGVKFEMFVFDALGEARKAAVVEVERSEEFSPVKQPKGEDSVESARRDMSRMYARWLRQAGIDVPSDEDGYPYRPIEIGPLFALDAGELAEKIRGCRIKLDGPLLLE